MYMHTITFKCLVLVGVSFFFKKLILLFSKDTLNCSKVTVNYITNKCCSIELSMNLRSLKNVSWFPQKKLSDTTIINIDNNKKCVLSTKSANYNDSEGSRDTENWNNGRWKFSFFITGINYMWKYNRNCNNVSQNFNVFFLSNKRSFGEHKRLLSKTFGVLLTPNFWMVVSDHFMCKHVQKSIWTFKIHLKTQKMREN